MRYALLIAGGLMILMGGVWLLQGISILPGSFMTGQVFWAVMGAVFMAVGGLLVLAGFRRDPRGLPVRRAGQHNGPSQRHRHGGDLRPPAHRAR